MSADPIQTKAPAITDAVPRSVRKLQQYISKAKNEISQSSKELRDGSISIAEWRIRQAQTVKNLSVAAYAQQRGGVENLTDRDLGKIGSIVKYQYGFLNNFTNQIDAGEIQLDDSFIRRALSYADSAYVTSDAGEREDKIQNGELSEERRTLGDTENSCDDCLEAAAESWSELGSLPAIGDSQCGQNCMCSFEYR